MAALLAVVVHVGLVLLIPAVAEWLGHGRSFRDAGDLFEQAGAIAEYTADRVAAAAAGLPLPEPPQVRGDINTARLAYLLAAFDLVAFAAIAVAVVRLTSQAGLLSELGLDRNPLREISRPIIAAAAAIVVLAGYGAAVSVLDIEWLKPSDAAPATVLRDTPTMIIFGAVTLAFAPVAEELFFRGLVFRGMLRYGLVPAIAVSSLAFGALHLSPQVLPLIGIGALLAWLYYTSGSLWQPIAFHAIFNLVSFVQFLGSR